MLQSRRERSQTRIQHAWPMMAIKQTVRCQESSSRSLSFSSSFFFPFSMSLQFTASGLYCCIFSVLDVLIYLGSPPLVRLSPRYKWVKRSAIDYQPEWRSVWAWKWTKEERDAGETEGRKIKVEQMFEQNATESFIRIYLPVKLHLLFYHSKSQFSNVEELPAASADSPLCSQN